jgi:hypothetical protein
MPDVGYEGVGLLGFRAVSVQQNMEIRWAFSQDGTRAATDSMVVIYYLTIEEIAEGSSQNATLAHCVFRASVTHYCEKITDLTYTMLYLQACLTSMLRIAALLKFILRTRSSFMC